MMSNFMEGLYTWCLAIALSAIVVVTGAALLFTVVGLAQMVCTL